MPGGMPVLLKCNRTFNIRIQVSGCRVGNLEQAFVVEGFVFFYEFRKGDGSQVAYGNLVGGRVFNDFGAEV